MDLQYDREEWGLLGINRNKYTKLKMSGKSNIELPIDTATTAPEKVQCPPKCEDLGLL